MHKIASVRASRKRDLLMGRPVVETQTRDSQPPTLTPMLTCHHESSDMSQVSEAEVMIEHVIVDAHVVKLRDVTGVAGADFRGSVINW